MLEEKPIYEHDCTRCVFLGSYHHQPYSVQDIGSHPATYDLYICPSDLPTVIARFGNDGPDYTSGLEIARHQLLDGHINKPLVVALLRAINKGYLKFSLDKTRIP